MKIYSAEFVCTRINKSKNVSCYGYLDLCVGINGRVNVIFVSLTRFRAHKILHGDDLKKLFRLKNFKFNKCEPNFQALKFCINSKDIFPWKEERKNLLSALKVFAEKAPMDTFRCLAYLLNIWNNRLSRRVVYSTK